MKLFTRKQFFFSLLIFLLIAIQSPVYSFAQSNLCGAAPTLTSAPGCFNTAGALNVAATYTVIPALGCGAANNDVWYTFTASSSNPTITLSAITVANVRLQIFSGTCAGLTSVTCGNTLIAATGLTPGTQYLIRIYSTTNAIGTFNICITDPHNLCAGAVTLTSGTSCINVPGNMYGATLTATTITAPDCASAATFDIWYTFVAQTTNPTITLSSIGVNFTNPGMQLLSNNCGGTFTPYFCGTTSIAADFLVPGTTYFIRVYSTSAAVLLSPAGAGFNICITDPVAAIPSNDECASAINLLISATCSNIPGTVTGATNSVVAVAPCTGPVAYDVWYKFTALTASSTITLGGAGTNFNTPRIQLFSGACGSLTSMACGTTTITNATVAGTTYYVRVYSTTGPAPNGNGDFTICVAATGALVRYGNSYVNITRKTTGGVVQPGDVLEIRMTVNHTSGTMSKLRFVDNVPTKTVMDITTPLRDSIKVITNEGLTFRKYTLKGGDDAGTYKASPPPGEYNVRLNLGFGLTGATPIAPGIPTNNSTAVAGAVGTMVAGSDRPRGGGGMLFAIAYRVLVTGVVGDTIVLNPSQFIYNDGTSDITLTGKSFKIVISNPLTLCTNSIGVNIASEFGGTFGSGTTPNRPTDLTIPISGYSFINNVNANNNVGDGRYAIVKNLSPRNRTITTARRQPSCSVGPTLNINDPLNCNNRMFGGFWYIDGDHTGTTTAIGNAPPASGINGGYMLMVNADFVASEIYRQDIINLCPNTYYEFSAWIKNICPTCGIDSTGAQFAGTATAPANGYVGVYPNLSLALNDVDYYSTGEVDTTGWQKRGFVFKTGSAQTTATFSIRNNSQGGGGNDWALDDIAVATCFPGMTYSPSSNPNVCQGDFLTITDTVRSFFNNYVEYKWQRWSAATSGPWVDIGGTTGTAAPVWNGSAYEYVRAYTIPAAYTTPANNGDLYRLVVASTTSNLSSATCSYTDPTSITLNVLTNCGPPLAVELISVNGRLNNNRAVINWVTSKEDQPVYFIVEKSPDGRNFTAIATVNGYNSITSFNNYYTYEDPSSINNKVYYRIVMVINQNNKKYSGIVQLKTDATEFSFESVLNPFSTELQYEIVSPVNGLARIELIDANGKVIKTESRQVFPGSNAQRIGNTDGMATGIYLLKASINGSIIIRRVMKK